MSISYCLTGLSVQDLVWPRSKPPCLYVKVTLGNDVRKTRIVKDNLSPMWDESFPFSSSDDSANIIVLVKHNRRWQSNLCVGCIDISIAELLEKSANGEAQVDLQPLPGKTVTTRVGVLHLHLQVSDERKNVAIGLEDANQAIACGGLAHSSQRPDKLTAAISVAKQGTDLSESLGELCKKLDVVVKAIDTVSAVHPYAKVAWYLASGLYKVVSSQIEADKKVVKLAQAMNEAFTFADEADIVRDKAKTLGDAIVALLKQTAECCIYIQEYARHNFAVRMFNLMGRAKIDDFIQAIAELKTNVESGVNLSVALVLTTVSEEVTALYLQNGLSPLRSKGFRRPKCQAGTRTEVRDQLMEWALSESEQNIFWLHGVAGSGKSTVSATVAGYFSDICRCGSFLSFERGKTDPNSVIRTIAYDLAMFHSSIEKEVVAAIKQDHDIASKSDTEQFKKLLLQPLTAAEDAICGPVIVVLDALDECGTYDNRQSLIDLIRDEFGKLPKKFRFIVTSRPESDISAALSSASDFVLPMELDSKSEKSKADVQSYIDVEMRRAISKVLLPDGWPLDTNLKLLGEAAGGLFIWAATAVKLVLLHRANPFPMFEELVEKRSLSLDELYTTVLNSAIPCEDSESIRRLVEVLSLILFSKEPLSMTSIDHFLGYRQAETSGHLLAQLRSVIDYSPDGPVRLFHTSFSDYLLSSERAKDRWVIDVNEQKTYLATRCFIVMEQSLKFNICKLQSSHVRNESVVDLQIRVDTHILPHLSYACLFWAQHLREAPFSSFLMDQLTGFLHRRLLYWLEVLSLTGRLRSFDVILSDAMAWTSVTAKEHADVLAFLTDARNLVASFYEGISQATPHIYISLLPLSPTSSKVAAHYLKHTSLLVDAIRIGRERRSPLLKTLIGHESFVYSVAFSPDGSRIATGSWDKTVRVWDASSGDVVAGPFKGHTGNVNSVAFSPDGARIASGSYDKTVRVWDARSGVVVAGPFKGHTNWVRSVTFSPDGARIASGSSDGTVCIWDASIGVVTGPFQEHTFGAKSVAFSPDGSRIATGSWDNTVRVWDASNGEIVAGPFEGHTGDVNSVAFSPDGARIASGSDDKTVRVWDSSSGVVIAGPFEGHTDSVNSVTFSPEGARIASGSEDETVCVWDASSGVAVAGLFAGHTKSVNSVAFSPDGARIASGSIDKSIRVWDAHGGEVVAGSSEGHTNFVRSVAFSPDGARIASGSDDKKVRVWDARSGEVVAGPFIGHTDTVKSVMFSPDGARIVSGSHDKMVCVWNARSGEIIAGHFKGHTGSINSVTFSPDGARIASGSSDGTVRVWGASGTVVVAGPFEGHNYSVNSVTFSPDGARIASGSDDETVRVWDASSAEVVAGPFIGHTGAVKSVMFSPDGARIASGSDDKTVHVWVASSGAVVAGPFQGHTKSVNSVAFSPDGACIASGSYDKTVRVWDASSGEVVAGPFEGHTSWVRSVTFSPDGTRLASGSKDKTIRVWKLDGSSASDLSRIGLTSSLSRRNTGALSNCTFDERGWLRSGDKLLLWIPPFLRGIVCRPEDSIFGVPYYVRLDISGSAHGDDWEKCWNSD